MQQRLIGQIANNTSNERIYTVLLKQNLNTKQKDIHRLEKKISLLNDKLDLLSETQSVALKKSREEVDNEEE